MLVNPTMTAAESQEIEARVAARALGLKILTLNAGSERDFDAAFAAFAQQGAGALLIAGNALFTVSAIDWSRWRRATHCLLFTVCGSSSSPAA